VKRIDPSRGWSGVVRAGETVL